MNVKVTVTDGKHTQYWLGQHLTITAAHISLDHKRILTIIGRTYVSKNWAYDQISIQAVDDNGHTTGLIPAAAGTSVYG